VSDNPTSRRGFRVYRKTSKTTGRSGECASTCSWLTFLDVLGQPLKAFKKTLSCRRTTRKKLELVLIAQRQRAYLGCTYHDRSRILCKPNFSVTSAGDIARVTLSTYPRLRKDETHLQVNPACWQIPTTNNPSSPCRSISCATPALPHLSSLGPGCPQRRPVPGFQYSNVSRVAEFCLDLRRPIR
jgi:hypothetical protein